MWRQSHAKRPTPYDIRSLCIAARARRAPPEFSDSELRTDPLALPFLVTAEELALQRAACAPLWDLVRRAKLPGADVDALLAERRRLTEESYCRDPRLREIDTKIAGNIEFEQAETRRRLEEAQYRSRCRRLFGNCQKRWDEKGFVCEKPCKAKLTPQCAAQLSW